MGRSKKVELPQSRPSTRSGKSAEVCKPIQKSWTKEEWLAAPFWGLEDVDVYSHLKTHGLWETSFVHLSVENLKILTTGIMEKKNRFITQRVEVPPAKPVASTPERTTITMGKLKSQLAALESQNFQLIQQIQANEKLLMEYQRSLEYTQATLDTTTQAMAALQQEVKQLQHAHIHCNRQTPLPPLESSQPPHKHKDRTLYFTGLEVDPSQPPAKAIGHFLSTVFPTVPAVVEEVIILPPQRQPGLGDHPRPPRCLVTLNSIDTVNRIMRGAYVLKPINAKRQSMHPSLPNIRIDRQLSYQERQERSRLWPVFQSAREDGRKAYWRGAALFIDNTQYTPAMPPSNCSGASEETLMSA